MSNRMSLCKCLGCNFSEWIMTQVFTLKTFDMTCISWNSLFIDHVIWSTNPVLSEPRLVTIYALVLVKFWNISWIHLESFEIKGRMSLISLTLSLLFQDLSLNIANTCSEQISLGRDMSCVASHVFLFEVRGSCNCSHTCFIYLLINL